MRHFVYLGVLAVCLLSALWLEPLLRLGVARRWRRLLLTLLPVVGVFLAWDVAAITPRHWRYDPGQLVRLTLPGVLPGRGVVRYDPAAIIGVRVVSAPVEDLVFGFALILMSLSVWVWWEGRDTGDPDALSSDRDSRPRLSPRSSSSSSSRSRNARAR